MKIKDFRINNNYDPYIIAEIGVNHEGSISKAKEMIESAASAGANSAKFQSYKAHKIASKNSPAYWDTNKEKTKSQFELFKKYDSFSENDYIDLADHCKLHNIDFMSTPFDLEAVDFLKDLIPAIKIASADITNIPLIKKCSTQGKPIIFSTGASTLAEIENAINISRECGATEIAILHCILNYPTPASNANLIMIKNLKRIFPDVYVGYSDHVPTGEGLGALEMATLFGASILEKHYTFDKTLPGNDHYHAMDESDLKKFIKKLKVYKEMLVSQVNHLELQKSAILNARRSIVLNRSVTKGEVITEDMLIMKRPGLGISPIHYDEIIGKNIVNDLEEDSLLSWEDIK
tara:strand:- start:268 stop:1311 length:1044 start_codon:yes stop_codon:yes gene_type:complete